jgi:hypothetical protein
MVVLSRSFLPFQIRSDIHLEDLIQDLLQRSSEQAMRIQDVCIQLVDMKQAFGKESNAPFHLHRAVKGAVLGSAGGFFFFSHSEID